MASPFPNAYYPFTKGAMCPTALSQFFYQAVLPSPIFIAYSNVPASSDFSAYSDVFVSSQTNSPPPIQHLTTHPMINRTKENTRQPKQFPDFVTTHYPLPCEFVAHCMPANIGPTYFIRANKDPKWRATMEDEFYVPMHNGFWHLVPYHPPVCLIGCKWVFQIKRKADGSIDCYKARLVAKGFQQQTGVDFIETFSPMIKPTSIHLILSLAITFNWPLCQLDIQNAFLHEASK